MAYKGYNTGYEEGIREFIKLLANEFDEMAKRSEGTLLHKTQAEFLRGFITNEDNIKSFLKTLAESVPDESTEIMSMTKKDRLKANDEGDSWVKGLDNLELTSSQKEWLEIFIKERIRRAVATALTKAGAT